MIEDWARSMIMKDRKFKPGCRGLEAVFSLNVPNTTNITGWRHHYPAGSDILAKSDAAWRRPSTYRAARIPGQHTPHYKDYVVISPRAA